MNELFQKRIDLLINQLSMSTSRSRVIMYLSTLGSFLIFISVFNFHFTWERKMNSRERPLLALEFKLIHPEMISSEIETLSNCIGLERSYTKDNIQSIYNHYSTSSFKNQTCINDFILSLSKRNLLISTDEYFKFHSERLKFTIPFLGIVCYVDDLVLIGGLGLLMLIVYYFFNQRRTYRILERLYSIMRFVDGNPVERYYTTNENTSEYEKLNIKFNILEIITQGATNNFVFTVPANINQYYFNGLNRSNRIGAILLDFLGFLPLIVMFFAIVVDIVSTVKNFDYLSSFDKTEFAIIIVLSLILFVLLVIQSIRNNRIIETNKTIINSILQIATSSRSRMREFLINLNNNP